MIKISVIIPIYNVEQYLKQSLDSVINQTLKDIEIICIDDCSTDNSYKILEEYKNKDSRIKLLKQDINRGVSSTRNVGLREAKGEYISFIDPDDYISNDYLESLYSTAKKYDSDFVSTLNIFQDIDGKISNYWAHVDNFLTKKELKNKEKYLEGETNITIESEKWGTKEFYFIVIWNKIFKRDFIINNDLFFFDIKNARADDNDFSYRVLANDHKASYNHKGAYYYRIRSNSVSKNSIEANIMGLQHLYNSIEYYEKKRPDLLIYLYNHVWHTAIGLFWNSGDSFKFYEHIYKLAHRITNLDKKLIGDYYYNEYMLIRGHEKYENYYTYKTLEKRIEKIVNALCWWIPSKKKREALRDKILRDFS